MRRVLINTAAFLFLLMLSSLSWRSDASIGQESSGEGSYFNTPGNPPDTLRKDTVSHLHYPFKDEGAFVKSGQRDTSAIYLRKPSNIKTQVEYDATTGEYLIYEKVDDFDYRLPRSLSREEYLKLDIKESVDKYWRQRMSQNNLDQKSQLVPQIRVAGETFSKIFGSNVVNIRPQGYVEMSLGVTSNRIENPSIPVKMQRNVSFNFDQKINVNLDGEVGDRMKMRFNYNTAATFDFENKIKLNYTGHEDDIVKNVEAGNVSMPLTGTLIRGGTNLFGVKTDLQFGKLSVSTVFSQQKGENKVINTEGGAEKTRFNVNATAYDANRHFLLGHHFYESYDAALAELPIIKSSITINKIEVWVTNKSSRFQESRNILALLDLGERGSNKQNQTIPEFGDTPGLAYPFNTFPSNEINGLYKQMTSTYSGIRNISNLTQVIAPLSARDFMGGRDYEKIENARLLDSTEYSLNKQLGYISLNQSLNADEVLAVAYQYTASGQTFQVGEFSTDGIAAPNTLILKMLKSTNLNPKYKNWQLMMKNIYNINGQRISAEDFKMDILFKNDAAGTNLNYLPDGPIKEKILLQAMNLDRLNKQLDPYPDGIFDFLEKITINSQRGRIIFPVIEPFGSNLEKQMSADPSAISKYVFRSLYDNTKTVAEQDAEKNKFQLAGSYKGTSSSEVSLNAPNISRGSVKVMAGGRQLQEDVDYIVDYTQGKVKIINQGLMESGTPISISTESEDLFSMQRKTMLGTHLNYEIKKNFNVGGTLMYLQEKPLYQKVNYGEDPISNLMLGLNTSYTANSGFITKMVNALPFLNTKEESKIAVEAEWAKLVPGHSRVISKEGAAYIDDFEGAKTPITLKSFIGWGMASTPQGNELFPEGNLVNDLSYGYNRALLSWYIIDPYMQRNTAPAYGNKFELDDQRVREVFQSEIFPARQTPAGQPTNIPTLDLAFYPQERGSNNYEAGPSSYSAGVERSGLLRNPESRWGGIQRKIETSDFEAANVEYIEFWLMDPFAMDQPGTPNPGGDLYFNLGDISEDVLRDGRKSFEQGLPIDGDPSKTDSTVWGRVSKQQSLVKAFDNSAASRVYQDIGLDGLNSTSEKNYFKNFLGSLKPLVIDSIYTNVIEPDPSSDDYHYFRGHDYDQEKKGILERYKYYSRTEGNSPTSAQSPESYPTAATSIPDVEDINDDNTLNENEAYYQYHLRIDKNNMEVGKNFISDIITSPVPQKISGNKTNITWYQFKIPINSPDKVYGSINDFRSIRFMRMFLKGWQKPVVLRFATLDLVRTNWRAYDKSLTEDNSVPSPDTKFDISAVSIEENSQKKPVNYVLPPGIDRVIDPSNPQLVQLNEQSMSLKVIDLHPGDARGAYKTTMLDMRKYKTLKLEVHAEAVEGSILKDDELYLFLRMGSDYQYNYYEYEIPLKLTLPRNYSEESASDRDSVWPMANRVYIPLDLLPQLKLDRNDEMRKAHPVVTLGDIYQQVHNGVNFNKNYIKVKGNPDLSEVGVMMIGIRNKKGRTLGPKSVEVWTDELRLTNFEEKGGWAGIGRVSGNLADLGTYSFAGRMTTAGFGSIDSKMGQRTMDDSYEYDFSTNLELGKFFKKEAGVKIPMYLGFSKAVSTPEYSPLDKDVKLKDALAGASSAERDSIKRISQTFTSRKSINFSNVQIDKPNKSASPKIWDISNFSLTYSHNEQNFGDINTLIQQTTNTRALLSYNFISRPKFIDPFKNIPLLKSPFFTLIRDFNFNLVPTQISFRSDINRTHSTLQYRNVTNPSFILPVSYQKDFIWNRYYDMRLDLTRGLKVDFSAVNSSRIDEPLGAMDRNLPGYEARRDSIWQSILDGGRNTHYHHTLNANYMIPVNKIPLLDWTSASTVYQAGYDWDVAPINQSNYVIGNTISNSRAIQLSSQLDFIRLYNKVPFLKKINQKYGEFSRGRAEAQTRGQTRGQTAGQSVVKRDVGPPSVKYKENNKRLTKGVPLSIFHKLATTKVTVRVIDEKGKVINGKTTVVNDNRVTFIPEVGCDKAEVEVTGQTEQKINIGAKLVDYTARFLMMLYNVNVSFTQNGGTGVYGYLPGTSAFGSTNYSGSNNGSSLAPGLPFILGHQDENFGLKAAQNGWISRDTILSRPYTMSNNTMLAIRAKVVPLPDLKIDIQANRTYSDNSSEFFIYNKDQDEWGAYNKSTSGNFSMSIISIGSSFEKIGNAEVRESKSWSQFQDNREIIAKRLDASRIDNNIFGYIPHLIDPSTGFPKGYGPSSQEVLIPAFLAAYSGTSAEKVSLDPFPSVKFMMPNWRIQYSGAVNKIEGLKNVMKSMNIMHDYRSTYNIGSYISNMNYKTEDDGFSYLFDSQNNFMAKYDIATININETFNPLIDVDITWINNLTTRFEYRKSRNIMLSLTNNQATEMYNNEASMGLGYRFEKMKLFIKTKNSQKTLNNDLNIRTDITYGKNKTILRKLVEENNQITAGQESFAIKFSADYNLSEVFIVRLFYDRLLNSPYISNSYRTTNSNFGVSFRFTLMQ